LSQIPDHDIFPYRIPHPATSIKRRGKKDGCPIFFVSQKVKKGKIILFLDRDRKKFEPN
jgi:hypothetical protein